MQDEHADACRCPACRPRTLRLVSSQDLVSTAVAEGLRKTYGLPTAADEALDQAIADLSSAEARLSPFRDEALRHGG